METSSTQICDGVGLMLAETEVRLRSASRELRRDSLRVRRTRSGYVGEQSTPTWTKLARSASEGWLGGRDSNPDKQSQSLLSYR